MYSENYQLDPTNFPSTSRLIWQVALKRNVVKLEQLTDIDMILIIEKQITGRYATLLIDIQKPMINI